MEDRPSVSHKDQRSAPRSGDYGLLPSRPTEPQRLQAHGCRRRLRPARERAVMQETVRYSEIISTAVSTRLQSFIQGPMTEQSLLCQAGYQGNTPKVSTFHTPKDIHGLQEEDRHGTSTEVTLQTDFPATGYIPKVQLPFLRPPGRLPRKIAIERLRREYLSCDITRLLAEHGIDSKQLMTVQSTDDNSMNPQWPRLPISNYLPLDVFDNEEFDCRTPTDWLQLGYEPGSCDRKPVPGKALLPSNDGTAECEVLGHSGNVGDWGTQPTQHHCGDPLNSKQEFSWQPVGVLDYNPEKKLYLVHRADSSGRLRDTEGKPIINGGQKVQGEWMLHPLQSWVPRIQLLFCAEDPRIFAQRVLSAQQMRARTEALLLYHFSVDCMPVQDDTPTLGTQELEHIKHRALSTPGLRLKPLEKCVCQLEKEICLEYRRTMNLICFDLVVQTHPEEFSHITLPQMEPERVPKKGSAPIPDYPFKKNRAAIAFNSLLSKSEVIYALCKVRRECDQVAAMNLFNVTFTKALRLKEFEAAQSQTQSQVKLYLRDTWVTTLCTGIRSSLRDVGPGWFDLSESRWDVYRLSKMSRLMALVRHVMQDSLRFLVQDSLVGLAQMLLDACHGVLHCPEDMGWGSDLINSPYKIPYK